ncbi:MAG: transmembrane anchor protein [Undibacterium sp.]|nr:transmembrane anchor protein [Undibacterium sp.]
MIPTSPQGDAIATPKIVLIRGMLAAAAIAGIILITAVLPAQYGIDPTGIGKVIGLTGLSTHALPTAEASGKPAPQVIVDVNSLAHQEKTVVLKQSVAYRADTRVVTLAPGKGMEIKTHLAKGATLIYSWKTKNGEKISHDFHGDPAQAKNDEFESFIEEKEVSTSQAALIAPFTGVHGWYWKNNSAAPVTVLLQASGFYTDMFYPHGDPASK